MPSPRTRPRNASYVVGEFLGGITDTTGEFNASLVHAINTDGQHVDHLRRIHQRADLPGQDQGAEDVVTHGTTVYLYRVAEVSGNPTSAPPPKVTTERYGEIRLRTSTPGTSTQPAVTITKLTYT